ncbi:chitin synthase-domain-containing protein [Dactylonectria macrodidyma]|uniref:Chitin synthase n=1 Tax=Dactylonectria macrodidyma TaxID=307937 RepID=A0A9P9II72_9HYPO|nr:chitin synthase-domain-containing protein [Dactylonectria macrodidyma]
MSQGAVMSIDVSVPSAIRNAVEEKYRNESWDEHEFHKLRYTAINVKPDDFALEDGYELRPRSYGRSIEHLICVTYYNEDKALLSRTLASLFKNMRQVHNSKKKFWKAGGPAWQKIVVCIVMDGIDHCDGDVLDILATMGVYQHNLCEGETVFNIPTSIPTAAHLFEITTQLVVTGNQQLIRPSTDSDNNMPPVQLMLCIKAKNAGKINSHRWIFNAFSKQLNPDIVVTIDTGTYLKSNALPNLWEAFYNDQSLAGACGALHVDLGNPSFEELSSSLLNPIVATQHFEYEVASQLERTMESSTGYLSVLPGAFSGYRYRALAGKPLSEYFCGDSAMRYEPDSKATKDIYTLNRFLGDDRILAFEVVVKPGGRWHTGLVSNAEAYTDVPSNTTDFINQRRRWLNGAFAATIYSCRMFLRLPTSKHNVVRQALLLVQLFHNILAFVLAWFSLSGFLLTIFVVNDISGNPPEGSQAKGFPFGSATPIVNAVIQVIYIATIVLQFILALGSRPKNEVFSYVTSFIIFAVIQAYMMMNLIYLTVRLLGFKLRDDGGNNYAFINEYFSDVGWLTVLVTSISIFGVYIAAGILALSPWHLFTSWAQYLFISSSYTNILNIYAFSNVNDVSWGHKTGKTELAQMPVSTEETSQVPARGSSIGGSDQEEQGAFDLDEEFERVVTRALRPCKRETIPEAEDVEAKFMKFRNRLVAAYIFSNFLVCIIVLDQTFQGFYTLGDPYWHKIWFFRVWMWGNSSLFLLKCAGMIWYRARVFCYWCLYLVRGSKWDRSFQPHPSQC